MFANDPFAELARYRLTPVIAIQDAAHALPLADALVAGGLPAMEITLRTPAGLEALRLIARRGGALPIAGTVLSVDQAQAAIDAGAKLLVTPGLSPTVVEFAQKMGVPICPGVGTPSEIQHALELGVSTLKFFPAEAFGGVDTLKAYAGPFPQVRFLPTGGITPQNLPDYLALKSVLACGGSWLTAPQLYANGDFTAVTQTVREALAAIQA